MAKEYIERKALINGNLNIRLKTLREENGYYDHYTDGFDEAVDRVENAPTLTLDDIIPHGRWIEQEAPNMDTYYDCSACGESFCLIEGSPADNLYNYCPNCGARMLGDDDE